MSLPRLRLESRFSPVTEFYEPYARDHWDLDPSYQRGDVWSEEKRRNLIRSLLMGIPTGAIIVNERPFDPKHMELRGAIIDGKQRITTLRMFHDGELRVPEDWFPPEEKTLAHYADGMVSFSDLSPVGQRRFSNLGLTNCRAHVVGEREEAEIYLLVNFGGVAQSEADRLRAESVS